MLSATAQAITASAESDTTELQVWTSETCGAMVVPPHFPKDVRLGLISSDLICQWQRRLQVLDCHRRRNVCRLLHEGLKALVTCRVEPGVEYGRETALRVALRVALRERRRCIVDVAEWPRGLDILGDGFRGHVCISKSEMSNIVHHAAIQLYVPRRALPVVVDTNLPCSLMSIPPRLHYGVCAREGGVLDQSEVAVVDAGEEGHEILLRLVDDWSSSV